MNKLMDATGVLTPREIITLGEMWNLRVGFDDEWLRQMDDKIFEGMRLEA